MNKRVLMPAGLVVAALAIGGTLRAQTADPHDVTAAQYTRWKTELSNWGRWGKDDEIGALNLITPEKRRQAAALVRDGVSVSLAADADTVKAVDNPNPYEVRMLALRRIASLSTITALPTPTWIHWPTSTSRACSTTVTSRIRR